MAKNKILGIEIGNCRIKIASCTGANLERMIVENLPDNLVREDEIVSWEAMADFIKEIVGKEKLSAKNVAVVLPEKLAYVRQLTMPGMTVEQLNVNLPYEFHDYITEDKDRYFFDYAVINNHFDELGKLSEMELIAVAAPKTLVEQYKNMFKRAGLRLKLIAPEFSAMRNIIKDYEQVHGIKEPKDYAILDMGHSTCKLAFFKDSEYEVTRVMEVGCNQIDNYIADLQGVDTHIAKLYKETNKDDILMDAGCMEIYNRIAVEVMRVLNFYNFNHPENGIDCLYCCGGGALIEPLVKAIEGTVEIKVKKADSLLTDQYEDVASVLAGLLALGITWE